MKILKISPDIKDNNVSEITDLATKNNISGIILTNTTSGSRDNLTSEFKKEEGGLSGNPLQEVSTDMIKKFYRELNSKIPIIAEPSTHHAILRGRGKNEPTLEYLPKNHNIKDGDKIYTSGKEGFFSPGIPIGKAKIEDDSIKVSLFSDLNQISFINVDLGDLEKDK